MFFHRLRRMTYVTAYGVLALGLMSGCSGDPVTVDPPAIPAPTIPVDFDKPLDQQIAEFNAGFKEVYCPVRNTPIADVIADNAKDVWNKIVAESQGASGIPTFDPKDPAMCQ